ncbi:hypothetical protein EDB83DRAFT_2354910, partial [Lactarius deliciosus]
MPGALFSAVVFAVFSLSWSDYARPSVTMTLPPPHGISMIFLPLADGRVMTGPTRRLTLARHGVGKCIVDTREPCNAHHSIPIANLSR